MMESNNRPRRHFHGTPWIFAAGTTGFLSAAEFCPLFIVVTPSGAGAPCGGPAAGIS